MHSTFLKKMTVLASAIIALFAAAPAPGEVQLIQRVTVKPGWNAVFVEVAPTNASLSDVFADWPTDSVGLYDPASFLATRQYSASAETQGLAMPPVAMWHRDYPDASDAMSLPANTVCLFFNTNATAGTLSVKGVPAAPRTTWHLTGAKVPYNFFGVTLRAGETVTAPEWVDGFEGCLYKPAFYRFGGKNPQSAPTLSRVYPDNSLSDGDVLLVPSDRISDWSGVLFVSPMNGLDYGTNATLRVLSVRNDSTKERTAAVELVSVPDSRDLFPALHIRDKAVALTNAAWTVPETRKLATKTLAPGETWKLEFGLDRSLFDGDVRGTPFGAVLRVTDDGGPSKLRVDVPIQGAASGRNTDRNAWPGGLWIAEVAFDEVYFAGNLAEDYTPSGGTLKVRLPFHVDAEGSVRLLQRVVVAGTTAPDGTFAYSLYAGNAAVPATSRETMRISSAVLPTETPVIPAAVDSFADGFLTFKFKVDANGATSLLRHPTHPQHDGLRWDFSTPAPDGDDFQNYKSSVKPELFSVDNFIVFQLDLNGGEAAWNPDETKTGTCIWHLMNLRREGNINLRGDMTIRRIAPQTDIVLE